MMAETYIAWASDRRVLMSSASGGIFQVLAKNFLSDSSPEDKRSVYGAWQDNIQFAVKHRGVDKPEDVGLLIGSKYYQSEMQGIYSDIRQKLRDDQKILFSGTPCQVAGLKRFLKVSGIKNTKNLLTVEVLCHGVSSRKVLLRYKDYLEKKSDKKIQDIHFRTKLRRWYDKGSSMEICYDDGSVKVIDRHADPFYLAFNHSMSLRPSCYSCPFAKIDRDADITIGDFWGAENYIRDKQKLRDGIGLVMVNSDTGMEFWEQVQDIIMAEQIDIAKAIPRNGAIIKSASRPKGRERFFDGLDKYDFDKLIELCFGRKKLVKIKIKGFIGEERIRKIKTLAHRTT